MFYNTMIGLRFIKRLKNMEKSSSSSNDKRRRVLQYNPSLKESLLLAGESSDGSSLVKRGNAIPKGHLAVYVGDGQQRFVIPTKCLSCPDFKDLMDEAADEFGYDHEGGIHIPCEEDTFKQILLRCISNGKKKTYV